MFLSNILAFVEGDVLGYMVAETKWVGLEVAEIQAPFLYRLKAVRDNAQKV